jgi:alpha-L-rhamnosidase
LILINRFELWQISFVTFKSKLLKPSMIWYNQLNRSFLIFLLLNLIGWPVFAKNEVKELRCEYLVNPVGIDVEQPRLSWKIISDKNNVIQIAYEIRVATSEQVLKRGKVLLWNSGKVQSTQSVNVEYLGTALLPIQRVYWQVRIWDQNGEPTNWSTTAFWESGLFKPQNWKASWISSPLDQPGEKIRPCIYFRKEFPVLKKIRSARIYVSALGLYELYLNGEKVSDQLFTPGWTSYNKRIQYQTYDITSLLSAQNVLGAILADGWYRGNLGKDNRNYYGSETAFIAQLQINYTDSSSEVITTDETWKTSMGTILSSDIYDGETIDARKEQTGWSFARFDDKMWQRATILDHTKNTLIAQQGLSVKAIQEIQPIKLFKTPKGEIVFNMGQNMVGWVRLKVSGNPGDRVTLKFAEVLDKDGNFYTENLRTAKATDVFFLKGEGVESFEPHFTFHGFRYVMMEGYPGLPDLDCITGVVIHSDMQPVGNFFCSDPLITKLQKNIQWSQKGNFLDIPLGCPQRDERLGWTGDAQVFCATAAFNFNVAPFFTKWMGDLAADQLSDGSIPDVIPDVTQGGGSAAWADAAVIIPWNMYLVYGDKRILEKQYSSMKAWVEYMRSRAGNDFIWDGDNHYGDWQELIPATSDYEEFTTNKDLIATAYYFYSTHLLAKIAGIIGEKEDAVNYFKLSEKIKTVFPCFITPSGKMVSDTQTAYILAVTFNLLPDNLTKKAMDYLANYVRVLGHLTTGFVGTPLICKTLADHGYADLAFMLLNRKEYPSWLYPVTQGATTIWERWDGQKPDGTFQNAGMNSFNHYAYGAIGEWLYTYIAGVKPDEEKPGYQHIFFEPHVGGGLTWAKAEFESMYGKIVSDWKIDGGEMVYHVEVPPNSTATLNLPAISPEEIMINGKKLYLSGMTYFRNEKSIRIEVGSGSYQFKMSYPSNDFGKK